MVADYKVVPSEKPAAGEVLTESRSEYLAGVFSSLRKELSGTPSSEQVRRFDDFLKNFSDAFTKCSLEEQKKLMNAVGHILYGDRGIEGSLRKKVGVEYEEAYALLAGLSKNTAALEYLPKKYPGYTKEYFNNKSLSRKKLRLDSESEMLAKELEKYPKNEKLRKSYIEKLAEREKAIREYAESEKIRAPLAAKIDPKYGKMAEERVAKLSLEADNTAKAVALFKRNEFAAERAFTVSQVILNPTRGVIEKAKEEIEDYYLEKEKRHEKAEKGKEAMKEEEEKESLAAAEVYGIVCAYYRYSLGEITSGEMNEIKGRIGSKEGFLNFMTAYNRSLEALRKLPRSETLT